MKYTSTVLALALSAPAATGFGSFGGARQAAKVCAAILIAAHTPPLMLTTPRPIMAHRWESQ